MSRGSDERLRPAAEAPSDDRTTGDLIIVLEPGLDPEGPGRAALAAEAVKLADGLDVGLRAVTWSSEPPAPIEAVADALAGAVRDAVPAAVLLLDSDLSRHLAPLVAHRCAGTVVVGCSAVTVAVPREGPGGGLSFTRPAYGSWLQREVVAQHGQVPVATLDLRGVEVVDRGVVEALAAPEVLTLIDAEPTVEVLERIAPDARSVDLVHARRIVTVGSGAASEELLAAVSELADLLDGSIGATRPVTDDGLLPKERLIGQTGRSVAPELYVALGVSGSPHHVAGVRAADRVISVNRDVRAPVFQFSDVGYVADLEEVLPALVRRIKEWRDEPTNA